MRFRTITLFTFIISVLFMLLRPGPLLAKVYHTKDEALARALPGAQLERRTIFFNDEDVKRIQDLSKARVESRIFNYYTAKEGNRIIGYAVFESHIVRTKPEVFMVVITPGGEVERIEVLAFYEPEEYLPPKRWLELFKGKRLDDQLWVRRGINAVSGATMTVEGLTREIRKALAVFELKIL
jgi:hypothetical protein